MINNWPRHWHTYFLCILFALLAILAGRAQVGAEPSGNDSDHLRFAARSIDTTVLYSQPPATTTVDGKALHIIQFSGPIQDTWLKAVEATGAELVHYVANYGYLVWAGGSSRSQLDRLATYSDFLSFSAPYSADLKADRSLRQAQTQSSATNEIVVTIQMLRHEGRYQTEQLLDSLTVKQLTPWEPVLEYQNMRAVISTSSLATIASLPDVVWIGFYQAPEMMDEKQAQILAGNLNHNKTEPAGPGYLDWLKGHGFSDDPQKYPIIDITDDGIGTGVTETAAGDRTFRFAGDPDLESRVAFLSDCTINNDPSGADGHGHLNASIAGGYDSRNGDPYQDADGYQRGMGVNPFGRIAGTRVFDGAIFDLSNCDSSYLSLARQSYQAGARIVSNSWGCPSCTSYNAATQAYDTAVRDADSSMPGNQELLILFSAGNAGIEGTVGSPANGKNIIAVGASENVRPTWTDGCGLGPSDANNLQDIAFYSSRGPAAGGRVKPDLVAPGTHIAGTASTSPFYNGSAICDRYHPGAQQIFAASSGTSHSVPAVAGLASLASYRLSNNYGIEYASPALLKAYLVASSNHLNGEGANDDLPSNSQGFGLPNMTRAFSNTSRIIVEQGQPPQFDETGQTWSIWVRPVDKEVPVRVVMAYTDQPGLLSVEDPQVNNLDLELDIKGQTYLGNNMDGQWSLPGGEVDQVNSVEAVYLQPDEATTIEVIVKATNIGGDGVPGNEDGTDQDFALICDNCEYDRIETYKLRTYFPVFVP